MNVWATVNIIDSRAVFRSTWGSRHVGGCGPKVLGNLRDVTMLFRDVGPREGGIGEPHGALGSLRVLGKIREYWGVLGYLLPLN